MASTSATPAPVQGRKRSSSIKETLNQVDGVPGGALARPEAVPTAGGFLHELSSFKWMVNPLTSLKMIVTIVAVYYGLEYSLPAGTANPLEPFLFISYPLDQLQTEERTHYSKGPLDVCFLLFYIIVFSFVRQSVTEFIVRPFARTLGIRTESKTLRFMEQAYAAIYFSASGALGLFVMAQQKSWWYRTEHYWLEYPHWRMEGLLKCYYLLQFSYWLQQMLVLILRLEKPRTDFYELILHHIVTLWLVGWSYAINLTMIGTAIFVSMDLPDICLAVSKCLNYLDLQHTSEASFVFFLGVWHYLRHYENLRIIHSVIYQFELIPEHYRTWAAPAHDPHTWWLFSPSGFIGGRLVHWMQWQILIPIVLLQLVNAFWSFLIWRILFRMIRGTPATDVREEEEDRAEEAELAAREVKQKRSGAIESKKRK